MTKHTPGPWVVRGQGTPLLCVTDHDSAYIVDRFTLPSFRPDEEREANARLIAAAPDLLVACKMAAERLHRFAGSFPRTPGDLLDVLDKAIAKAETDAP